MLETDAQHAYSYTPGRCLIATSEFGLRLVSEFYFILDEVDRMLDMAYEDRQISFV